MSNERIDLEAINMPDMKYFTNEATWQGWHDTVEEMIAELKRCYEELDRPKVTIDDWDKEGPCVTVYLEGKEYVGILREYDASE